MSPGSSTVGRGTGSPSTFLGATLSSDAKREGVKVHLLWIFLLPLPLFITVILMLENRY